MVTRKKQDKVVPVIVIVMIQKMDNLDNRFTTGI